MEVWVGGSLNIDGTFATKLQSSIPAKDAAPALERLINFYVQNKASEETFTHFVKRIGIEEFQRKFDALAL